MFRKVWFYKWLCECFYMFSISCFEIIKITTIITQHNYFIFNNKYYTQPEGLPMGSPISSILAEIFIHDIEQTHILNEQNNKYANKIIYWYRYVDDILLLYNGNTKQLHQFINKLNRKFNFTFLYLTITKTDTYSIYAENPPPQ